MTWEIALGIFALVSFAAVIIGWSTKIASGFASLEATLKDLNHTLKDFQSRADKTHSELSAGIKRNADDISLINITLATMSTELAMLKGLNNSDK